MALPKEDPNSKTGKLTLDKAGLQSFLDDRVIPFTDQIRKIQLDDPVLGPAMGTLLGDADLDYDSAEFDSYGSGRPLSIGMMLKTDYLHGKGADLNKAVGKSAEDLVAIFEEQQKLFGDIEENLKDTISTLFSTQGDNLINIEGQEFLDIFEDVDDSMATNSTGGSGENSKEE
ncbi:type VII secretion system-associated protein [Streptomyces bluensis]|uniref:Type VII secretion system-associated protein n=1 Tax=Streptomyces bluensis TaxID=33897 RepID=A0ABW6UJW3_9ACTN